MKARKGRTLKVVWGVASILAVLVPNPTPSADAQLSPGPLSEAHRSLEGILQCTNCHALGLGEASFKCLDCHTEIRSRVTLNQGYHSRLVESETDNESCVTCHAEHYGRDFELVTWPTSRDQFDHSEAGYLLEGVHSRVDCADCHTPDNMTRAGRAGILMDLERSMLGLDQACLTCHEDVHEGQLSEDCATCHSFDAWSPVSGFGHETTRFPLTGLHAAVACVGCHTVNANGVSQFTGIAFQECQACHQDPHAGGFDAACSSCHNTRGWGELGRTLDFDHSTTRFPLEGAHAGETCRSCHEAPSFGEPIPHDLCLDCHADYHQGQFASRRDRGDCEGCHSLETFETSTFTATSHNETSYPLVGMHTQVECNSCHEPAGVMTDYHPASEFCLDCHQDSHDGQFQHLDSGACESCHTAEGFRPSTYTLADHADSRFPLDGAHRAVVCFGCHTPLDETNSGVRFRMEDRSCQSCHEDPHVPPAGVPNIEASGAQECESCHQTQSWNDVSSFDHSTTRFELLGAHRATTCTSCHELAGPSLSGHVQFASAPDTCAGCHEDVHAGQFQELERGSSCESCHSVATWNRIDFDHEQDASFSLEGAHEAVSCNVCHVQQTGATDATVRIFRGTPTECEACH